MRNLTIIILLSLLSFASRAQTKADYKKIMSRFVKLYNQGKGDSIVKMWQLRDRKDIERLWTREAMKKLHDDYGKITSFKYLSAATEQNQGVTFETNFSKMEPNGSIMLLDKKDNILTLILINAEPKYKKNKNGK